MKQRQAVQITLTAYLSKLVKKPLFLFLPVIFSCHIIQIPEYLLQKETVFFRGKHPKIPHAMMDADISALMSLWQISHDVKRHGGLFKNVWLLLFVVLLFAYSELPLKYSLCQVMQFYKNMFLHIMLQVYSIFCYAKWSEESSFSEIFPSFGGRMCYKLKNWITFRVERWVTVRASSLILSLGGSEGT